MSINIRRDSVYREVLKHRFPGGLLDQGTLNASVEVGARVMGWTCRDAGCRRSPSRWRMSPSSPGAPCHWAGDRGHVRGAALRAGRTHASEKKQHCKWFDVFHEHEGPTRVRAAQPSLIEKQLAARRPNCPRLASCKRSNSKILELYTYRCHNTKHVHLRLSQYKTCTHTAATIQNMYTYSCLNTKHVHLPRSQYKTSTPTAVTIQNMYTYNCHNTKHVHIQLSQYKTSTPTAVTIQNMYTYRCHNTKHVYL